MNLPFLNRSMELARLKKTFASKESSFVCLYGRRRCGKSSLIQQAMAGMPHVYFVGDEREPVLQRRALAREISRLLPGFERAEYHSWDDLLERWYLDAPSGGILALDELPYLASASPELPGILQKQFDRKTAKPVHTLLCGSSQRMMYGLVLDSSAPLYGRAKEIMKIEPLKVQYLKQAMGESKAENVVEAYSAWGGVPRYWELALDFPTTREALCDLVLNPLGVLHREPERLLTDQMRDTRQAASLLSLIGQGCHRLSEISARLEKPSTSLSRPLAVLTELGLVRRETPFGVPARDSKRTLYKIADPFLGFWMAFVEPNMSMLEAGFTSALAEVIMRAWPQHAGFVWEELARSSVPYLQIDNRSWKPAFRWWGKALDAGNLELDIVAESLENSAEVLVGEAKSICTAAEAPRLLEGLRNRASSCPALQGRKVTCALFVIKGTAEGPGIITAGDVVEAVK